MLAHSAIDVRVESAAVAFSGKIWNGAPCKLRLETSFSCHVRLAPVTDQIADIAWGRFDASMRPGNGRGHQPRAALFVCMPGSEQKSAPRLGARMLLDIGQIDGVTFYQKLDCRPDDQERRNVDREYLKGFHGNSPAIQIRTLPQPFRARWVKRHRTTSLDYLVCLCQQRLGHRQFNCLGGL